MKKLILTVALIAMSSYGFPQSGGLGGATAPFDTTTNPSGTGFGGGLGGATSPGTQVGGALGGAPSNSVNTPPTGTSGTMGTSDEQRMEDNTNFAGGTMSGDNRLPTTTPDDNSRIPSGTSTIPGSSTTPQTTPDTQRRNVPGPSGVGTGYPSGF